MGVCDRDAREKGVEGGGGETETFLKGGTAAVTESLEVLTCIWAACQPEPTRVPLPSTSGAAGELCCVPFQSRDLNARRDKLQQILNKCCMGISRLLTSSETLEKARKSSPLRICFLLNLTKTFGVRFLSSHLFFFLTCLSAHPSQ